MSESTGELKREMGLAQEIGPIRQDREPSLSVEAIKRELHVQRDDSYRGLVSRFRDALGKGLIERDYYDIQLGRLKKICLAECGPEGVERVFGPERPTAVELQELVESIQKRTGYFVGAIGRKEEYTIWDGKITGPIAITVIANGTRDLQWYPVIDNILYKEISKADASEDSEENVQYLGSIVGLVTSPWHLTQHGERVFGWCQGKDYLLVDGEVKTRIETFEIGEISSGIFDAEGRFSGWVSGTDHSQDSTSHVWELIVHDKIRREIAGLDYRSIKNLVVHDDGTVSGWVVMRDGTINCVFRDQIIREIEGKEIHYVHWLSPDPNATSLTGIFKLEGWSFMVIDGKIQEEALSYLPKVPSTQEYRDFQVRDGQASGIVRTEVQIPGRIRGRDPVQSDEAIVNNQKFPLPTSQLSPPTRQGNFVEAAEVQGLSVSEEGKPSFAVTNIQHDLIGEDARVVQFVIDGQLVPSPIPDAAVRRVSGFHVYDGTVNGEFEYLDRDGWLNKTYVVLGRVMESIRRTP